MILLLKGEAKEKPETKRAKSEDKESNDGEDDDEIKMSGKRKYSRIRMVDSDDSDRENEHCNNQAMDVDVDSDELEKEKATKKKSSSTNGALVPLAKKKKRTDSNDETNGKKLSFEEKLKSSTEQTRSLCDVKETEADSDIIDVPTVYAHNKLEWLKPENIRDAEKRKPSHPMYDPKTLYVPDDFLNKLTPVSFLKKKFSSKLLLK